MQVRCPTGTITEIHFNKTVSVYSSDPLPRMVINAPLHGDFALALVLKEVRSSFGDPVNQRLPIMSDLLIALLRILDIQTPGLQYMGCRSPLVFWEVKYPPSKPIHLWPNTIFFFHICIIYKSQIVLPVHCQSITSGISVYFQSMGCALPGMRKPFKFCTFTPPKWRRAESTMAAEHIEGPDDSSYLPSFDEHENSFNTSSSRYTVDNTSSLLS